MLWIAGAKFSDAWEYKDQGGLETLSGGVWWAVKEEGDG